MEVLYRLKENNLFVKPENCFFKVQEVEMFGLIIGPDGIKIDPKKVEAITAWSIPVKLSLNQGLGLACSDLIVNICAFHRLPQYVPCASFCCAYKDSSGCSKGFASRSWFDELSWGLRLVWEQSMRAVQTR